MKKILIMFVMAVMFCSCGGSQKSETSQIDSVKVETIQTDSVPTDSVLVDSIVSDTI